MRGGAVPAPTRRGAGARADRGRAADGRPGPRGRRQPEQVSRHGAGDGPADRGARHRHQGLDGARARSRAARASRCTPARAAPQELLARGPRRDLPRQRPRRPGRAARTSSQTVRELVGRKPVWGICLGHQLLCRAVGLETFKLPFGHRGANHPVKDLHTGASRSPPRTTASPRSRPAARARSPSDEPVRWETDFGAAAALAREPLRPHRRGPRAARRARRRRAVPPRGRARAARQPVPVRPLPGDGSAESSACRAARTSTRS